MIKENTIIHGDCLDIMKNILDKSIDLVLTDPPYGIDADKDSRFGKKFNNSACQRKNYIKKNWDNKEPSKEYWNELFRISKNQIIFGVNYFHNYNFTGGRIFWNKNVAENYSASKGELAFKSFGYGIDYYLFTWSGMRQEDMKNKQIRKHPTEKPIGLLQMILKDFSKENDLIFDGFAGSGTTALACIELNRRFICVEKDLDYYNIAKKRIDDAKSQLRLF